MPSYSTRQRKVLLAYLSQHPDELLSARQTADALADENQPERRISKTLPSWRQKEKCAAAARAARARSTISTLMPRAAKVRCT